MRSVVAQSLVIACVFGLAAAGCTVKTTDVGVPSENTTEAGAGGSAGSSLDGGDGGAAGDDGGELDAADSEADLDAASGDAGELDGGEVDGGDGDGAARCLDDSYTAFPDCSALSYAGQSCAGTQGAYEPWGIELCSQASTGAQSGVFEALYPCLAGLDDPCDDDAVQGCIDDTFPRACTTTSATSACAAIAKTCVADADGGTDGGSAFDEATCVAYVSALRGATAKSVAECVEQTMAEAGDHTCADVFGGCITAF